MWWSRVPFGTWEVAGPRGHLDDAAQQLCRGGFWLETGVWEGSPPLLWQLKPWKRVRSAKERAQTVERPIFWEIGVTPFTQDCGPWWRRVAANRQQCLFGREKGLGEETVRVQPLEWPCHLGNWAGPTVDWGLHRRSRWLQLPPPAPCRLP